MHQTPAQKHILKTSWFAGAFFLLAYAVMFIGDGSEPGSIIVRKKWAFLMPYLYLLLVYACWSWDYLVKKDYIKAGIMLAATAGIWALNTYVFPIKDTYNPNMTWMFFRNFLLSPLTLAGIARAILEANMQRSVAALLAALVVNLLFTLQTQGQYGLSIFVLPYAFISDYIFQGNMRETVSTFLYSPLGYRISTLCLLACYVFVVQWVYQFFCNRANPEQKDNAQGIFGKSFPRVSGRYFASAFPILYVFTISAATCIVVYLAHIFSGRDIFSFMRISDLRIPLFGNTKTVAWVMLPISAYFTVVLFKVLRTLVLSRCITLNKKFGLNYLFSFVPFLNIIPWIILSVTKTPTDEHERLEYATEMNDPAKQRSMAAVNLLITLAILNVVFSLLTGINSGGGFIGLIILLITLSMYISFMYRPDMIYGVIGIRLVFLVIILFSDRVGSDGRILFSFFALYSILMLFWQMRIFHPEVEMPVEVTFDSEREAGKEPGSSS